MAASGKGDGQFLNAGKKRARKRTADQAALEASDSMSGEAITSPESTKQVIGRKSSPKKKARNGEDSKDLINDTIESVIKDGPAPGKNSVKKKATRKSTIKQEVEDHHDNSEVTEGATAETPEQSAISPGKNSVKKKVTKKSTIKQEETGQHDNSEVTAGATAESPEHSLISPDDEIWTTESVKLLLERIKAELPKDDKTKYSTQSERLDWEKLKFEHFTAEDCKHKWNAVVQRLRRFRTMTDLVQDAEEWAKVPWSWFGKKKVHPDLPRRPLSPYLRFFMEKVPKFRKDYPKLAITAIAKMIAEKFKALPAKKKQKYTDGFNVENEKYKSNLEKFREEHPDLVPSRAPSSLSKKKGGEKKEKIEDEKAPPKPTSAQQLFVNAKLEEIMISQPELTKMEASQELKKRWTTLKESKKMKYINMALEGQKVYEKHMEVYCKGHPDFQPKPYRAVLTKAEEKVRDHHFGKPEKPPKMGEISRRWKALSEKEKDKFNKAAEQKMKVYKTQYEKYRVSLPEEERERLEKEEAEKANKKVPKTNGVVSSKPISEPRPKRPMSALFMFINEKKDKFKQRYPNISNQDIVRLLSKAYSELADSKREKYKKKELDQKAIYEQELQEYLKNHPEAKTGKENNRLKLRYPGEPKKPPGSGYQLFSAEMMGKWTNINSKYRLQEVSARWKNLSELEKVAYNQRRVQMVDDYKKQVEKFKAGLSAQERCEYEEIVKQRGRKTAASITKGITKKLETKKPEEEEEKEQEEESESGESGSEEDSSSEEGSDDDDDDDDDDEEGSEEESSSEEEDETTTTETVNNNTAFPIPTKSTSSTENNAGEEKESSSESESESDSESSSGESSSEEGESE